MPRCNDQIGPDVGQLTDDNDREGIQLNSALSCLQGSSEKTRC